MPRMKVTLGIGFPGANHEEILDVDETEWEECESEKDREELMETYWQEWVSSYMDGGYELID